jgi:hypothetical protein
MSALITIVAISSVKMAETALAMRKTHCELSRVFPDRDIDTLWIDHGIDDIGDYNRAVLGLAEKVKTDYALIVQHDGYALNGNLWEDSFLHYDYIGAPIPFWFHGELTPRSIVGNGGFSLRSQKFLSACAHAKRWHYPYRNEDVFMTVDNAALLKAHGIKVAPFDVALRFSHEHRTPERPFWSDRQSFGFHGRFTWYGGKIRDLLTS